MSIQGAQCVNKRHCRSLCQAQCFTRAMESKEKSMDTDNLDWKNQVFSSVVSPVGSDQDRANVIRKALGLRMEMNESVGAVSGKLGELYISHCLS